MIDVRLVMQIDQVTRGIIGLDVYRNGLRRRRVEICGLVEIWVVSVEFLNMT